MNRRLLSVLHAMLFVIVCSAGYAQTGFTPGAGTTVSYSPAINDTIYDPGGPGGSQTGGSPGNYPNCGCITTITLTGVTEFRFDYFSVNATFDWVKIYDGATTAGTLIFDNETSGNPFYNDKFKSDIVATQGNAVFSGSSGDMTIEFRSSTVVDYGGFAATITKLGTAPTCAPITFLNVSNINANDAQINWTAGGGETAWNIEYGPVGFTPGSGTVVPTGTNPHTLMGLNDNTSYDVWVQADCGAGDLSANVGPVTFTTLSLCPDPSNLSVNSTTTNSADLAWTNGGSETAWNIEYGPVGFTQGSGTVVPAGSNPFNLTGLSPSTGYEFYVQADCGSGDVSNYVGPFQFATQCNSVVAPWNEDFENAGSIPVCWTQGVSNAEDWNFDNAAGVTGEHVGNGGTIAGNTTSDGYFAWVDDSSPHSSGTTLESPLIDVTALTAPELTFFVLSDNEGDSNVDFQIDVWDGATWNTAVYTRNINTLNEEWEQIAVSLASLNITGDIQLRFIVNENNGTDFDDDIAIDDIDIHEGPSCPAPAALTANNITGNSVELSWTNGFNETSWNIEYGAPGFPLGTGTSVAANSNPFTLTGLTDQTDYEIYIQADCGGGDLSTFIGPISITTPCNAFVAPYLEQFNIASLPNCWDQNGATTFEYGNDVSNPTGFADYGAANIPDHSNNNGTFIGMDGSDNTNGEVSYLYSPLVDVSGLTTTEVRYYIFSNNEDDAAQNKIIVEYNNGSGWVALDSIQDNLGPDWSERVFYLASLTGNNIQVRFEITGDNSMGGSTYYNDILIDDFEIKEAPTCLPVFDVTVNSVTETTVDVSWSTQGSATSWNIEYGPTGYTPGTGTSINTSNNPETLTGLIDNTDYDVYVQADCGGGDLSTWTGPVNFTTATYCTAPVAFQTTGSTASSIDLQWAATGTETSWNIEYGPAGFTPGTGSGTIEVATTIPYTVTGLQPGTVYEFYVQAGCSQGQNNPFTGPITYSTPIVNDAACDAIAVPVDGSTTQYTNAGATLETGELTTLGDNTVWFTFTAPADGHVEIRTCGNDFDNFMEVYETTDCADFGAYTIVDAATDNPFASCSGTTDPAGLVLCGLTPGNTYYLVIGSETAGNTGIFPLTLTAISNAEAGNGTVTQVCSGDIVNLFGALSGNDNGGVWSEIDVTGGLDVNGTYVTTNLAYTDFDVQYTVNNECSMDSAIVTVSISGPSQAGQDGTLADCNVLTDFYLYDGLSGNLDFGGTWIDVDGTGKLNGSVFSPDSLAAGTYQFDYITSNDVCPADTSTVEVTIQDCLGTEEFTAESFKIFPNPTQGIFYIVSTVNAQDAIVEITDLQGKVISSRQMNINAGAQYDFDLSQLERGVYLIKMATEDNTSVKRVVLQR